MIDKLSLAENIENIYSPYFDISKNLFLPDGKVIFCEAKFHSKNEKYFIVPSAKIWSAETNEYLYIITDNFNCLDDFISLRNNIINYAMNKIKPHKEHMYTYITIILISDFIESSIEKEIKRFKKYKSFMFSFYGWMHFRMIAIDLNRNKIFYNPMGKELKKTILMAL